MLLEKIIAASGVFWPDSFLWGFRNVRIYGKTEEHFIRKSFGIQEKWLYSFFKV